MTSIARPPYSADVAAVLTMLGGPEGMSMRPDDIVSFRKRTEMFDDDLSPFDVTRDEFTLASYDGVEIELTVFTPTGAGPDAPCLFQVHGGGMVMGDRLTAITGVLPWAVEHSAVLATIEYRLAPEHPDPAPVEDAYAGLVWVSEHTAELGIDPLRIVLTGASAGGGIAAGVALLARDRGGPAVRGQLLSYPMLDDRDATVSTRQFDGVGLWDRESNRTGWGALLGERRGGDDVSIYAAPARATDLAGLPSTFIEVASAELFRDECVAFASRIWEDGGRAELHVWPGSSHGFDILNPQSRLVELARATRMSWLRDLLTNDDGDETRGDVGTQK